MDKIIKSDYVVASILIGTWLFYLTYEGSTRFDINQTVTLPLLAAADFTALAIIYAAARYYTIKHGKPTPDELLNKIKGLEPERAQDKAESENNKS